MEGPRDFWARFRDAAGGFASIATGLAAIGVPLVALYIGNNFAAAIKQRELDAQIVQIAVQVLRDDPAKVPGSPALRDWAIGMINRHSDIPLNSQAQEELRTTPLFFPSGFKKHAE
ncbi:hypothetical protein [Tistlia consotensis]|uniref:hypothetical protein n=1 Tax=Tistlia consotensis TaxID=1321365 RepID=UPI001180BCEE|nr:hypothetical protein [Tistlia consotensis]